MTSFKSTPDHDGDYVDFGVTSRGGEYSDTYIAIVGTGDDDNYHAAALTRDDAATLATHLTAAVEAADAREAAEASKLKRGDKVQLRHTVSGTWHYTVTRDEDEGLIDIVCIASPGGQCTGKFYEYQRAASVERIPV